MTPSTRQCGAAPLTGSRLVTIGAETRGCDVEAESLDIRFTPRGVRSAPLLSRMDSRQFESAVGSTALQAGEGTGAFAGQVIDGPGKNR